MNDEIVRSVSNGVGLIRLNRPKALNALSENMIAVLYKTLSAWKEDESISIVLIEGEGEKAFCAGGDMRALYDLRDGDVEAYAEPFFAEEYRMNILMHRYPKPVLVYMNGYVMGGGVGIAIAGSHRIVNEKTRWAMPEMNIGFYPDVGGSFFLSRMKSTAGRYLALTSNIISGEELLYLDAADFLISSSSWDALKSSILTASWTGVDAGSYLNTLIAGFSSIPGKKTALIENEQVMLDSFGLGTMEEIAGALEGYKSGGNEWAGNTLEVLLSKSPISQKVTLEQLIRGAGMELEDCFRMEMNLSLSFMGSDDFYEGTRSVLVDKDRNPKWNPDSYEKISREKVESFFSYPWKNGRNPLA